MAVSFELYQTPMPEDKKNKIRYHARPVSFGTVSSEKIIARIHNRCTLRESDIVAALNELKMELANCLKDGQKVHIEGLGYFQLSLSCEEIRDLKEKRVYKVKMKTVNFRADKALKAELHGMEFVRSKIKIHSTKLSHLEIDMKLKEYFAEKQIITRIDFQYLCELTKITASRHIKRLIEEKKLKNLNTRNQPIYAPVPGNYGVSVNINY